jgi:hypothetical protein
LQSICERVDTEARCVDEVRSTVQRAHIPKSMENMMNFRHTVIALSLATLGSAFAQTTPTPNTPRIDSREAKQEQRIDQGVASGSLTQQEADRLNKGQERVAAAEEKAKADGTVTKKERARLTHMQNKQNRHIKAQKHDRQKVAPAG